MSSRAPTTPSEERGIDAVALDFHKLARPISEASDGVKAFTGLILEILAGDPMILLIDEPEAFLHPSLASKLGGEIARAVQSSNKRVFASTHSPWFVMGCVQSGLSVNIVRLTYRGGAATARVLPSDDLKELMRNPLLRSTGVLSALFYEAVVITESDADRAFYQEINERLLQFKPDWGIPNCLFINAQNMQTIRTIMKPLRDLGILAAAIVDVDVLGDGGGNWTNLLRSANIPDVSLHALAAERTAVNNAMRATGKNMKSEGGISILNDADKEAAENLLSRLRDYGVFAVPCGELESWLKPLSVSGHGPEWLISMFAKMGSRSDEPNYVHPAGGDVWEFINLIREWFFNSERRGIPG